MRNKRILLVAFFGAFLFIHLTVTSSFSYTITLTQDYLYNEVNVGSVSQSSLTSDAFAYYVYPNGLVMSAEIGQRYDSGGSISIDYWGDLNSRPLPSPFGVPSASTQGEYTLRISDGDAGFVCVDYRKTGTNHWVEAPSGTPDNIPSIEFGTPLPQDYWPNSYYDNIFTLEGTLILEVGKDYSIFTHFANMTYGSAYADLEILDVRPVPEPTTMLLLGCGLVGLVGYGRRGFFKK